MTKRLLSMLLAIIMVFSIVPFSAFADTVEITSSKDEPIPTMAIEANPGEAITVKFQNGSGSTKIYDIASSDACATVSNANVELDGNASAPITITGSNTVGGNATISFVSRDTGTGYTYKANINVHVHEWDKTQWAIDETNHWYACKVEGCTVKGATFKHNPGASATCTTAQTCTACNYELAPALGHDYNTAWETTTTQHWHECKNGCGTNDEKAAHVFTDDSNTCAECNYRCSHNLVNVAAKSATCDADGYTAHQRCTKCGYTIGKTATSAAGHTIDEAQWEKDATDHWHVCQITGCAAEVDKTAHKLSARYSFTSRIHYKTCSDCGHAVEAAHTYGANDKCTECNFTKPAAGSVALDSTVESVDLIPEDGYKGDDLIAGENFKFKIALQDGYIVEDGKALVVKVGSTVLTPDANGVYTIEEVQDNKTVTVENVVKESKALTVAYYEGTAWKKNQNITVRYSDTTIPVSKLELPDKYELVDNTATTVAIPEGATHVDVFVVLRDKEVTVQYMENGALAGSETVSVYRSAESVDVSAFKKLHVSYKLVDDTLTSVPIVDGVATVNIEKKTFTAALAEGTVGATLRVHTGYDSNKISYDEDFMFAIDVDTAAYNKSKMTVMVNGTEVKPATNLWYTLTDVKENQTITVSGLVENERTVTVYYKEGTENRGKDTITVPYTTASILATDLKLPAGCSLAESQTFPVEIPKNNVEIQVVQATFTAALAEGTEGATLRVPGEYDRNKIPYDGDFKFTIDQNTNFEGTMTVTDNNGATITRDKNGWYTLENVKENQIITVTGLTERTKEVTVYFYLEDGTLVRPAQTLTDVKITAESINEEDLQLPEHYVLDGEPDLIIKEKAGTSDTYEVYVTVTLETFTVTTDTAGVELVPTKSKYNPESVVYDNDFEFVINILEGYQQTGDLVVKVNGEVLEPETYTYKYLIKDIQADQVVTVEGVEQILTYKVTKDEDSCDGVEIVARNGYDATSVEGGNNFKFKVQVASGYIATNLKVEANGTEIKPNANDIYTIRNINADVAVLISGVMEKKTHTVALSDDAEDLVTMTERSGFDRNAVQTGKNFKFTLAVNSGYVANNMKVYANGTLIKPNVSGVYTIKKITANQVITVEGVTKEVTHKVTMEDTDGVTMVPKKNFDPACVKDGNNFKFTLTVDSGYDTANMVVCANGTQINPNLNGVYTIKKITADQEITVEGVVEEEFYNVQLNYGASSDGVSIVARKNYNADSVKAGENFKFTVEVESGYDADDMVVYANGKVLKPNLNGVYTIKNIQSNQRIIITGVVEECAHYDHSYYYNGSKTHSLICDDCGEIFGGKATCSDRNADGYCDTCSGKLNSWYIPFSFLYWL